MHIVSIICLTLCILIFFYLKWYVKQRTSASGMQEHRTETLKLIAEINAVTDRDLQLVEDRVNKLKLVLHEVDKRIELYEKELENITPKVKKPAETLYNSLGKGIRAALREPHIEQTAPAVQMLESAPVPPPPRVIPALQVPAPQIPAQQVIVEVPASVPPAAPPPVTQQSKKQIRAHIDILANEGLSAEDIASQLDISIAEVNLAMNLRRKK